MPRKEPPRSISAPPDLPDLPGGELSDSDDDTDAGMRLTPRGAATGRSPHAKSMQAPKSTIGLPALPVKFVLSPRLDSATSQGITNSARLRRLTDKAGADGDGDAAPHNKALSRAAEAGGKLQKSQSTPSPKGRSKKKAMDATLSEGTLEETSALNDYLTKRTEHFERTIADLREENKELVLSMKKLRVEMDQRDVQVQSLKDKILHLERENNQLLVQLQSMDPSAHDADLSLPPGHRDHTIFDIQKALFPKPVSSNIVTGTTELSDMRYVMVRSSAVSVDYFALVQDLYGFGRKYEAIKLASNILFDMGHSMAKSDAPVLLDKIESYMSRYASMCAHIATTGWGRARFVDFKLDSHPPKTPEEFYVIVENPSTFESDAWLAAHPPTDANPRSSDTPTCIMFAGYCAGWCEHVSGWPLICNEVQCRARGDPCCRFVICHASRVDHYMDRFTRDHNVAADMVTRAAVTDLFERKAMEEQLRSSKETAEEAVAVLKVERELLQRERQKSEQLLNSMLPKSVVKELKAGSKFVAHEFPSVSILFTDMVGFTTLAARMSPSDLVSLLNVMYSAYDELSDKHGVYKVETIGDSYMVAAGCPDPLPDHAQRLAALALDMQETTMHLANKLSINVTIRVGIHSGPVVAGVIGQKMPRYHLFGDSVNTASRMESTGVPGCIQVSAATARELRKDFVLGNRGELDIKGKGKMRTFLLMGKKEVALPDPTKFPADEVNGAGNGGSSGDHHAANSSSPAAAPQRQSGTRSKRKKNDRVRFPSVPV